ncbi:unnamed protein product [Allacma fusca]|uniref:Uncharacterized protein n=1 Tax=Allacma fusca TaxID=39272 RepID=A0A8J2LFL2_9HEXA|nr:unnamed protein product [Allacma fusca]
MGCSPSSPANKDDAGVKTSHSHPISLNSAGNVKMNQQQQQQQQQQHSQFSSDGKPADGNLIRLGPMSIYRPHQLHVVAAFPREDALLGGIRYAVVEKLGWNLSVVKSATELDAHVGGDPGTHTATTTTNNPSSAFGSHSPSTIDLLLLDYRQPKLLSPETLTIINFFEKNESGVEFLLDAGIDKVEIDHGLTSTVFWLNELLQLERSLVNAAYKLTTISTLLTALDHCRDMIQITDAHHRVQCNIVCLFVDLNVGFPVWNTKSWTFPGIPSRQQFVNRAYEKVLGYSSVEISGSNFIELQFKQQQSQVASQGEQQGNCNPSFYNNLPPGPPSRPDAANSPTNPNVSSVAPNPSSMGLSGSGSNTTATNSSTQTQNQVQLLSPAAPFHDHVLEELQQGKEWEGNYMYNRKTGDPIFLNSRVLSFNCKQQYSDPNSDSPTIK